jgi:hypothetical protein
MGEHLLSKLEALCSRYYNTSGEDKKKERKKKNPNKFGLQIY